MEWVRGNSEIGERVCMLIYVSSMKTKLVFKISGSGGKFANRNNKQIKLELVKSFPEFFKW